MSKCKEAHPRDRDSRYSETPQLIAPISFVFLFPGNLKTLWVPWTTMIQKNPQDQTFVGFSFLNSSVLRPHKTVFSYDHQKLLDFCFTLNHVHVDLSSSHFSPQRLEFLISLLLAYGSGNPRPCPSSMSRWCQVSTEHLVNSFTTGWSELLGPHSGY